MSFWYWQNETDQGVSWRRWYVDGDNEEINYGITIVFGQRANFIIGRAGIETDIFTNWTYL